MAKENTSSPGKRTRRRYTKEFREEAVQVMLDGHSASSVAERLRIDDRRLSDATTQICMFKVLPGKREEPTETRLSLRAQS